MSSLVHRMIAFGNKTGGRDKLCRLLQYSFRGLSDLLDKLTEPQYQQWIKRFKKMDYNISTARKLMRLGKSVEMIYQAKNALYITDVLLKLCISLSKIASACFLFLDHIIWLSRMKLITSDVKPISELANRFWMLSGILNLIRNAYDWSNVLQRNKAIAQKSSKLKPVPVQQLIIREKPIVLDAIKNFCDILIPMHGLQYVHVSGMVQGATGVISSMIGIATIWDDSLKLVT